MESRLWNLYNLIKQNSLSGKKTTQQEICEKVEGYDYKDRKGTTDKCSKIWLDIDTINSSDELEKLILTKNYEYWIGTEQETNEYIEKYFNSIAPSLKRYWNMVKKAKKNNQYKMFSLKGDIIDEESKARQFVDSFIQPEKKDTYTDDELRAMEHQQLYDYLKSIGGIGYIGWTKQIYIEEIRKQEKINKEGNNAN